MLLTRQRRLDLIKKIEAQTNSKILVYITGDRLGLETKISSDVIPFIYKHLKKIGDVSKISLLLYTTGGITIHGYGIVNLIREYCNTYDVIVPFKCLSTGTLMALGANSIIMSKMGQLGPVDPSLRHPLAPDIPNPQNLASPTRVPVSVEDVISFFDLAKKEAKTNSESEFTKVLEMLVDAIHPLVLGAVNRSRNEIRFLTRTMLKQHIDDEDKINDIIRILIEERFSHNYLIGRKEAKEDLGLNIVDVSEELMEDIMELYDEYSKLLKLDVPHNNETIIGKDDEATITFHRSVVESAHLSHIYSSEFKINRVQIPDSQTGIRITQYPSTLVQGGWVENDQI